MGERYTATARAFLDEFVVWDGVDGDGVGDGRTVGLFPLGADARAYASFLNAAAALGVEPALVVGTSRIDIEDAIYQTLVGYRCAFTQIEDDGGAMPLIDLLSPGSSSTGVGKDECGELAGVIVDTILARLSAAPAGEDWLAKDLPPKEPVEIAPAPDAAGAEGGA